MPEPENTFSVDPNQPAQTPEQNPQQIQPANPLNTGNGAPQAPAQPVATPAPAPATPETTQPHEVKIETTQEIDKKMEEELAKTETEQVEKPPANTKKYLIIGIVAIAILTGGYFAYSYFFTTAEEPSTGGIILSPDLLKELEQIKQDEAAPSIGSPFSETDTDADEATDKMKELEEIVDELENIYAPDTETYEEAVLEDPSDDAPPSLSQSETPEEEQSKKILR